MATLPREDEADLRRARAILENPSWTARLTAYLGKPLEEGFRRLPQGWQEIVAAAARKALFKGLSFTILTLGDPRPRPARETLHRLLVTATGTAGGALGVASLPVELPVSTCLILRSIADIARSEGHDLSLPTTRLACLEVLAIGPHRGADHPEGGYWITRSVLAKAVSDAAAYLAHRGLAREGAPPLVRLVTAIAPRFGVTVSQQAAARAVPIVGALGGGTINYLFMRHFQEMARGHFIILRLEKLYGSDTLREIYETL
ncbi:MAG TPA: EcsC family protein [Syntrophales bacterium]|nr:EcsC family protein [Syntrophales bacterium]HOM06456.1 EcsC family protein [Syntrophales bacterium]HON99093.1 EcsC family protein [Syntrophales bacterium]HPC00201.1 EcsC family protein [Syntrophales bacterium]HPQ05864.1 EcsC family protein [Syntrophales bacterium]